jgi:hypothetical protein
MTTQRRLSLSRNAIVILVYVETPRHLSLSRIYNATSF